MSEEERNVMPSAGPEIPPEGEVALPELPPEPLAEVPPVEVRDELPAPARAASEMSDDDRLMAALAWVSMVILQLPIVSLVLLIAEGNKNRPFQRYHAVTSILFWGAAIIYEILAAIVFTILTIISLGCLGLFLWVIFFLPHLAALYYALQAYNGKQVEIPGISSFARQQGWA